MSTKRDPEPRLVPVWPVIIGWIMVLVALALAALSWSGLFTGREFLALILALAGSLLATGGPR